MPGGTRERRPHSRRATDDVAARWAEVGARPAARRDLDAADDQDPAGPRGPGFDPDSVRIEVAVPGARWAGSADVLRGSPTEQGVHRHPDEHGHRGAPARPQPSRRLLTLADDLLDLLTDALQKSARARCGPRRGGGGVRAARDERSGMGAGMGTVGLNVRIGRGSTTGKPALVKMTASSVARARSIKQISGEVGSAASYTSTCRSHDLTGFSAPTGQ
jgi:hypothetical protein